MLWFYVNWRIFKKLPKRYLTQKSWALVFFTINFMVRIVIEQYITDTERFQIFIDNVKRKNPQVKVIG